MEEEVPNETTTGEPPAAPEPDQEIAPAWSPPPEAAPSAPDDTERTGMHDWLRARPVRVTVEPDAFEGAMSFPFLRYLNEIVSTAGLRNGEHAAETVFMVTVAPQLFRGESALNWYGTVELDVEVFLEGTDAPKVTTSITGPPTLSRISSEDAQLNSLREIQGQTLRHAVTAIREELSDAIASRGIPYRVERSGGSRDEIFAVFRSLGIPAVEPEDPVSDVFPEVWLLFGPPATISRELGDILDGSGYGHAMHPLNRTITIIYNEEN
jgi:hypothetical protein